MAFVSVPSHFAVSCGYGVPALSISLLRTRATEFGRQASLDRVQRQLPLVSELLYTNTEIGKAPAGSFVGSAAADRDVSGVLHGLYLSGCIGSTPLSSLIVAH
jgi:hypothetical protein